MIKATPPVRTRGYAVCAESDCTTLARDATRERVRLHVGRTHHTVRFVVEEITYYRISEAS